MATGAQIRTISIVEILGLGDDVRVQNPSVFQTKGRNPKWYIRPFIEKVTADGIKPVQERIYLGPCDGMTKKQAIVKKNEVMAKVNRRQYVISSQINFGDFLDHYEKEYLYRPGNLAASTQAKYASHLKNHIRPAFECLALAQIDTRAIDAFLAERSKLSSNTRKDLRNLLCALFTQAERWGIWKDRNPALHATVGRHRPVRHPKKLSIEETCKLLASLPEDLQLICVTSLSGTLRISEVLGVQWKHVNWKANHIEIRQRYYRGDVDEVKSERAKRDIPMGPWLKAELLKRQAGPDEFVFSVKTCRGICRDDRDMLQHFIRPAAKRLGVYSPGFGFHSFRREAITALQAHLNPLEVMRLAGHSKLDMTAYYTLADSERQAAAVNAIEGAITGAIQ